MIKNPVIACIVVLLCVAAAHADVVSMQDGRSIEGTILAQSDDDVTLDAVVSHIRLTLILKAGEIASIEKKPLRLTPVPSHRQAT